MVDEPDQHFINVTMNRKRKQDEAIRNPQLPSPTAQPRPNLHRLADLARLADSEDFT